MGKNKGSASEPAERPLALPPIPELVKAYAERAAAAVAEGRPVDPALTGTFTIYVTPEQSMYTIIEVTNDDSPVKGEHAVEVPARILRAIHTALEGGLSPMKALKVMLGMGKGR